MKACKEALKALKKEDEYSIFGSHVATKLKNMDTNQRAHAENLINQVLYKGQLKKLSENYVVVENNMSGYNISQHGSYFDNCTSRSNSVSTMYNFYTSYVARFINRNRFSIFSNFPVNHVLVNIHYYFVFSLIHSQYLQL